MIVAMTLASAPVDSTPCRRCGRPFDDALVAFRAEGARVMPEGRGASLLLHPLCAVDVDPERVVIALSEDARAFAGRDAVAALAGARIVGKSLANRSAKAKKGASAAPVEMARDPIGRPRVRVLCLGAVPGFDSWIDSDTSREIGSLLVEQTLVSPLREYVMAWHSSAKSIAIDPSQPFAAAIYCHNLAVGIAHSSRPKLMEWSALGVPSPVLLVVGEGADDAAKCDAVAIALRQLVEKAGFSADESTVLCGRTVDDAMLQRLALALDEVAEIGGDDVSGERVVRVVEQLERAVEQDREELLAPSFTKASRVYSRARVAEKQRIAQCALRVAAARGLWSVTIPLLTRVAVGLPRESLAKVAAAMLAAKKLPPQFEELGTLWLQGSGDEEGLYLLLIEAVAVEKPQSDRAQRAARWLAVHGSRAHGLRLAALAEALTKKPAQRAFVAEVAASIAARKSALKSVDEGRARRFSRRL